MVGVGGVSCSLATFDDEVEVKFRGQSADRARARLEQVRGCNVLRGTGRYLQALRALEQLCSGAGVQVGILLSDGEPTEVIWEKSATPRASSRP
ncbi:unnamed protein product [Prorocentrum cordatum]|uniref:VWFA domain-containing protein n=1 Tax=Prorocentrum cordatum TaxID=2364126 RepID=A0ABN9UX48_9DINO|nr:unnamed protein product [Polarella glacialis]